MLAKHMPTYTVHHAKTHLSKLIERAEAGEDVVIARGDKPAVKLVPVPAQHPKRKFGAYKGELSVPDSFFDPLPEEVLAAFEGGFREPEPQVRKSKRGAGQRKKRGS